MLKWLSGDEGGPGSGAPGSPQDAAAAAAAAGGDTTVTEVVERLAQTEQLVTQLKEMIREKDAALHTKDDQLKVEKEAGEAKLSKLRLQNKAKVTSLTAQLEELKKQQGGHDTPTRSKKGASEGGEQASRGKIVLLKKKVEELEQQLVQRDQELEIKKKEVGAQLQRGEEMDIMLTEKDKKLAEKEAYIVHLQTALAGDHAVTTAPEVKATEDSGAMQELQLLVQSLTKKVGEAEERYSLLQEQTDSLKGLLATEKEQYSQKESMYKQNIQTFKDIILQKDNQVIEINQMHEQELFKLAAKSDASADLEQLLKALKQKLHEKEEVLLGKTQVIDVLQGEVDGRDQQIKEFTERLRRLQVERESLESKMEAEKHVMRAQLRDLMEKQQAEVRRLTEQHQAQMDQAQHDLLGQQEERRRASVAEPPANQQDSESRNMDLASIQRITELEAQSKQKADEASKSEAKFLKMKAWSKSRIRQLEEELRKSQAGIAPPDLTALRRQITALEEERQENFWKFEQYDELKAKNDMLETKLVVYEEQQRTLQADLEQVTKRAASQASESGSADDTQSQVLEWQEMVADAVSARDRAREERTALALRINHMEEEREALASRQQELEEELAQAQGISQHRAKKLAAPAQRSLQEDFEFDGQSSFQDPHSISESTTPMEGENMGGGLRSVVEELELERNQLQEQILSLEERCHDLEDRLQLQARIEALQNDSERLQSQLASVRSQLSRDAEKHQLLVSSLNEQLKGLSDTQESLESSLIEKENTLAKASEKLELISSLRTSLSEKEIQYKDVSDKLLQNEQNLMDVSKKCSSSEKQCTELKTEVADLTQKHSVLKEKTQKQDVTIETLQTELDQTNEELDKLNTAHLEERALLIHDLQSCEREIDSFKEALLEKENELSVLSGNMAEYADQVTLLKQEIKVKEDELVRVESALCKTEREAMIIKGSQNSDQQGLNSKISELVGQLKDLEMELIKAKEEKEHLIKQAEENKKTMRDLQGEVQKEVSSHRSHLSECETRINSLKEEMALSTNKLKLESEGLTLQLKDKNTSNENLQQQLCDKEQMYEKEQKSLKDEQNKLLVQVAKFHEDVQALSKQLEEQVQSEEQIKNEVQEKLQTITSLENRLKATDKQSEDERQKFSSELKSKTDNISKLKNTLKSIKTEKQQLQNKFKVTTEELEVQKHHVQELDQKLTSAAELKSSLENQVNCLTKENESFQVEITERIKSISERTAERDSRQAQITIFEKQLSQNSEIIKGLQRDNQDLSVRTKELNRVMEQSTQSNSEILLAKTNECSNLGQLLRDREEELTQLQERVQSLISKEDQLQHNLAEKDQTVTDLQAEIASQQNQQKQLQEKISLLKEQECSMEAVLMERDTMLKQKEEQHKDLQKSATSKLQAEVESLHEECSQLGHRLENYEMENTNLKQELEIRQTKLSKLQNHIQAATEENHQLRAACELKEKELAQQTQIVSDLDRQLKVAVEQNSNVNIKIRSLTEDHQNLQEDLAQKIHSHSELTTERRLLQEKTSQLEMQMSENQKVIHGLLKEKEDLTIAAEEVRKVLQQHEQSNSMSLLEKTTECTNLSKILREREEQLEKFQEHIDSLKVQVEQLNMFLKEKEETLSEQSSRAEAQQSQLLQSLDTLSMLQEQASVLKSALMEKDTMLQQKVEECSLYQNDVMLQKELVSKMTCEVESFREECLQSKKQMEQKEQILTDVTNEFKNHKDELNKRNESLMTLSSQLGAMNESAAEKEVLITNLEATVQKLTAEKCQLMDEDAQRKGEVVDFRDNIQALNDQNTVLKSELQKTVTNLSRAQEEAANLRRAVSVTDTQVSHLTKELKTAGSDKERLNVIIQEKDDSLKRQETLIQQFNTSSLEVESQKCHQTEVITQLQSEAHTLQQCLKDQEHLLKQTGKDHASLQAKYNSETAELNIKFNAAVEKTKELNARIAEQEMQLTQKVDDNISLTTQISELEDSVLKLRGQVDHLTSESTMMKKALETREQSSLEYQSTSSAAVENLNSKLEAKEAECCSMKEQLSHLKESVMKLNNTLQVQISEKESLKTAMEEKEASLLDQSMQLQDVQRKADEAVLFKSQFIESTELASQLQTQVHLLSTQSEHIQKSAEDTQSVYNSLKEKCTVDLEELQDVKKQLRQRTDEVSNLKKILGDIRSAHQATETTIETLRNELSANNDKLQKTRDLNSTLTKEKEDAFASHQASVSSLTVEIEKLKSQHIQVVAKMNALTENLEQREMALHAINSQYTAQDKHTAQLVAEIQKVEEQNKRLKEEIKLSKEAHHKYLNEVNNEKTHLQEELKKRSTEKDELERRHHQIWATQGEMQIQMEQQSSSMNEIKEKMVSEKESLQAKVSAKDGEISQLKANIQKIEQILQDSENEWLLVLDREKQDKNLLVEQLKSVETEMKAKDVKVSALKQDLDSLQEQLTQAATAIRLGSDQLKAKELEASASKIQLEKLLLSVQEKDSEKNNSQQTLKSMKHKLQKMDALNEEKALLEDAMKHLRQSHQSEVDSLKNELDKTLAQLQKAENILNKGDKNLYEKCQQISVLQEAVQHLEAQLNAESEKVKEAAVKHISLHNELLTNDEQIKCLSIQISQQKELLSGLSQQLRDKDASIAQVMESALNERLKLGEEKSSLITQLETVEREHKTSLEKLEDVSRLLEEHMSRSQSEIETKNSENDEMIREFDRLKAELAKVSKERDTIKKKLQAALVVRKDLMKKIERYELQIGERVNDQTEVSLLQDKIQEITAQAQATTKTHEENVLLLEKTILEKEEEILQQKTEGQTLVEQLQAEKKVLQASLQEKEVCLSETLQSLDENSSFIKQLQSSISDKEDAFDRERNGIMQNLEGLRDELKKAKDLKDEVDSSAAAAFDLKNELAEMKQEKAKLQKKTQAALLALKETRKKAQEKENKLVQELAELKESSTDVQLKCAEKVKELEDIRQSSLSLLDELDTLKQLVEERDKTLQDFKMSLAERESQCHSVSHLQTELDMVKSKCESINFEMTSKDEALSLMEQKTEALNSKLQMLEDDLTKAHANLNQKTADFEKSQNTIDALELKTQLEKQALMDETLALQSQLNIALSAVEEEKQKLAAYICSNEEKVKILIGEKTALFEQIDQMKVEIETTAASISQKKDFQKTFAETQQQFIEHKDHLTTELEKVRLQCTEREHSLELVKQEKENAIVLLDQLRDEASTLIEQLKEVEKHNEQLHQKICQVCFKDIKEDIHLSCKCAERFEAKLKDRDCALLDSQAQSLEKEQLIAALELQLKQQLQMHDVSINKMKTEVVELQKSQEDCKRVNDQDSQGKTVLLTKKLQAALISRKELLKENTTLKEQVDTLSAKQEGKEKEYFALESSLSNLKQRNVDLESCASSLKMEKEKLSAEVDRILNDNHCLSAACDSLKLTIESITQQKQGFSCQLESLKDSQTEELSKWKSKHAELKEEYESLLQAYENVSSEMDKMRQLLEGAKRDRQEALRKIQNHETEMESLEKQIRQLEEENERMKDKMRKFSKTKQLKIEELEEENKKIREERTEFDGSHENKVSELSVKNQRLESEICTLEESLEDHRNKCTVIQAENHQLTEKLKEAKSFLENRHLETNSYANNMQLKFDEALGLNNSLTAQIEAQKTELGAQMEITDFLQKERQNLSARIEKIQNDHELQLGKKDEGIQELQDIINGHNQEAISLNEKFRILEDDKSLLQEELENVQEISDKVKNENEYLETVILKNSEVIDELTESAKVLQTQNAQLSSQLAASKETSNQVRQVKEQEQLRLVRDFEEKLKAVQRGNEGTKNVKKELRELLKEKHQEINHLQQTCIRYQELSLDLERSWKTSHSACEDLEEELKKNSEKISHLDDRNKQIEAELVRQKNLLQEATEKIVSIQSERDQLALEISVQRRKKEQQDTEETKRSNTDKEINSYIEKHVVLQKHIDDLQSLKDGESQKVSELKEQIDSQHLQMITLKRAADTNEAKLSALSTTPDGEDATNRWNDLYQKTLHEKDSQLLEQGFVIKRFLEDMRVKDKEVDELRVSKSRLERTLNEFSVAAAAHQRQLFVTGASNTELAETVEFMTVQLKELSAHVDRIEQDKSILNRQLAEKEDVISQIDLNLKQMEEINSQTDAQLLLLQSQNDNLQSDCEKQEGMTLQLKTLLQSKNAEISSLLSCRDGQMSGYLEQLQANYRAQVAVYEDSLTSLRYQREKADKELRGLEAKNKSLQMKVTKSAQEKGQMEDKMESFRNSMVSLQTERERLMSEFKILQTRNQLGLRSKDGSVDGEVGATKGLKHEIRKLLHQMDDLNSENAMLRAQLVRYREDLNNVLSLKDNQLKVLLKKQEDVIQNLENKKAAVEKQHRESLLDLQKEEEASNILKAEISKLKTGVTKLEADTLRKEKVLTNEGRVIADLQQAVAAKSAECNDLQQKLNHQKIFTDEGKEKMQFLERDTDKRLSEAEVKFNSELDTYERAMDVMKGDREVAEQRVIEIANDLIQTERDLNEAKAQSKDIRAQNESLGKAMAALQNDRDQLIEDFKILQNRYDQELRDSQTSLTKVEHNLQNATSDLAMFAKERHILDTRLKALEGKDSHTQLNRLLDELSKELPVKEKHLKQATLENNVYSRQLSAFSKSMASLQNDRDRLSDELAEAKRVVNTRQESSPQVDMEESNGNGVNNGLKTKETMEEQQKTIPKIQHEKVADLRSARNELHIEGQRVKEELQASENNNAQPVKETVTLASQSGMEVMVRQLETERIQLHRDLQRCLFEIQQRDQNYHQLNANLHQVVEEKGAVAAQLRAVSQTLRDTQNRCHWLESQVQGQTQGSVFAEVAPGAPQERTSHSITIESTVASQLQERLLEVEQNLAEERGRREAAEDALRLAEDRAKSAESSPSRDSQRDFSIQLETEEEWDAHSLNPNQPLITRKVKGGMVACRQWLRGRSLYFSKLLTSRTRSRYFFLAYLLTLHVVVLMCLTGSL
ncbi:uncharacterized protein LOC143004597 isoform X2 [Genypterus blacodes]|uniref:uncharacterized protein LOC143004597 isoform X2 n=1 Tax=Genypterus blacodes TaxID=154954 RepID=UPI003F75E74D